MSWAAPAATITNYLTLRTAPGTSIYAPWDQQNIAINTGDTVVWVNRQAAPATNYVESYGGEWGAALPNPGDSFAFTFTNPGFYAYRTGLQWPPGVGLSVVGSITVSDWAGAPPAVTINSPVDGAVFPWAVFVRPGLIGSRLVQASVADPDNVARIQYFVNSNLVGTAASPPYGILWTNAQQGEFLLTANALDRQGVETVSKPVRVSSQDEPRIWGPHLLPGGRFLLFFSGWYVGGTALFSADGLQSVGSGSTKWGLGITIPDGSTGVFVDETAPYPAVTNRFYFWNGWLK